MADDMGKVPILACAREAWQFCLKHWRAFLPAAAITAVVSEIIPTIMLFGDSTGGAATATTSARLGDVAAMIPAVLAGLMFAAAVLRKAIRDEFIGATGLAFGADEARLLGVFAALMCLVVPFGTLAYLVLFVGVLSRLGASPEELQRLMADPEAFSVALQNALGQAGTAAFLLFMFFVMGLLLYVFARLFMINAATIGERRVVMFQTWGWTRGNVLRALGAIVLTWIPAYIGDMLVYDVGVALLNAVVTPQNAVIAIPVFKVTITFVAAMLSIPSIALGAILYRGLRPRDFAAK